MKCKKCGAECIRDEVDIGVGVQYGPWGCPECGWSQIDDLPDDLKPEYYRKETDDTSGDAITAV